MAHKVALINMKGGVGKSTLTVNLAWAMASYPWNKRVLVVDLDPQFNCSQYLLGAQRMEILLEDGSPTVWDLFEQHTSVPGRPSTKVETSETILNVYSPTGLRRIDLIPSRLELAHTLRNPANKEGLLEQAIEQVEEEYDLVLVDCAPTDSMLTSAAYMTVDHILVPVRPEFLAAIGLPLLKQSLDSFKKQYPSKAPDVLGIAFNDIVNYSPEETTSVSEVRSRAQEEKWYVFDEVVRNSRSFPRGAREGRPIFGTSYARTKAKSEFRNFAQEFAERLGL